MIFGRWQLIGVSLACLFPNTRFTPVVFMLDSVYFSAFFAVAAFPSGGCSCTCCTTSRRDLHRPTNRMLHKPAGTHQRVQNLPVLANLRAHRRITVSTVIQNRQTFNNSRLQTVRNQLFLRQKLVDDHAVSRRYRRVR